MRILHITQRYWPALGGAENYIKEVSTRLAADGHQVTLVTTNVLDLETFWNPHRRRVDVAEETQQGVHILRFPLRYFPLPGLAYPASRRLLWVLSHLKPVPVAILRELSYYAPWTPALWRWLNTTTEPFDLVACTNVVFEGFIAAGLRLARRRKIPMVTFPFTHLGSGARPASDPPSRFYTMRHQVRLVHDCDAVVAQTPTEKKFYEEQGIAPDRLRIIGPGTNPEQILGGDGARFRQRHQLTGPIVAFLSAMAYDKGAVTTVEAVRQLWQQGRQVHLVLAGAIMTPFQAYLDQLPPEERQRILVLGPVSDEEKRDLLAACDLFAMPSRVDSFGIVYLEAWLYGKPVIGAQTWGVNDVITHGADGLLVPFGDTPALATGIATLLDDPALAARMGEAGRQKVYAQHTWDQKYAQLRALYQHLVAS